MRFVSDACHDITNIEADRMEIQGDKLMVYSRFDEVNTAAAELIERLTAENTALREKQRWIPVAERMPEERVLVNVVWVNRAPEPYYERIKNVPFSGTACFYRENWYWDSPVVLDLLAEYGEDASDLVDEAVEITNWMPLPEAPEEGGKA